MSVETNPESQLVGTVTGGYRVMSPIGSGAMGHVYEAEDVSSGKRVALKVLHKNRHKELAARFLREGKTLALLSHPNIVQLVDMGQLDDGALFLATELIAGDSLRTVMDRGPLDRRRALSITRQLLEALDAAHAFGVVHRDVKPENVMVTAGDVVKVLDFGVAKLLAESVAGLGEANLTTIGFSMFGSALYIAPESVTGQPVDARLDLYSTGAMLFEMLAGRPPFDDPDPSELLRKQAFVPAPTLAEVAPTRTFTTELEALVARALAKQPDDRFRSAADMIAALDAAVQALEPPPPPPVVAAAQPRLDQRRLTTDVVRTKPRYGLVIAGAAVTVMLALVIVIAMKGGGGAAAISANDSEHAAELLAEGHAQFALGHQQHAVAAYERALHASSTVGTDQELRTNLLAVLDGKDALASILALDLLGDLTPAEHDAIASYASTGKLADTRRRALMIAERDGFVAKVDRIQAWTLDLQQASSCDERKATIEMLARSSDRRAIAVLKRMRSVKCLEREAADAIARLEALPK